MSAPLTEKSTQDVPPMVNLNPILDETNEIPLLVENVSNKYPYRSNWGVLKKQYELDPKTKTKCLINNYMSPIDCQNRMHFLLINYLLYLFLVMYRMH